MGYDWLFRDALVYDGTGAPGRVADVAVEGDRIAEVGAIAQGAARVMDARGLALAPGFIDVHTHDDFAAVVHPDMAFKTTGGVTTCIVGNCGMGAAPYQAATVLARSFHPHAQFPEWEGYAGYFSLLDRSPPGTNIGVLIGHGTARMAVMGRATAAPDPQQLAALEAIVCEGLDAGAIGLSTGLVYEPGRHAATEELVHLASLLRGSRALYTTHMRDEGLGLLASVEEAIRIGEAAGVGVQISHHKASGRPAWGLVTGSLQLIESAQRRGVDVHADQYPYTAGSTVLSAVAANGRLGGGGIGALTADDVVIASTAGHPDWEGRSISALMRLFDRDLEATLAQVLRAEPGATVVLHTMSEDDVRTVMRHPSTMIGSDGLPTLDGRPHPRLYGTFARVLGRYARDLNVLSMPEAVYRMTGFPAAKFGLDDRGLVKRGLYADLVLFDPATIIDRGTFEDPNHAPAGIHTVLVNGTAVVQSGRSTGARPGRALRRNAE